MTLKLPGAAGLGGRGRRCRINGLLAYKHGTLCTLLALGDETLSTGPRHAQMPPGVGPFPEQSHLLGFTS